MIDEHCYFYQSTNRSSNFEEAQEDCASRFPNGGKLFEPQSLEISNKVLTATSNHGNLQNYWLYIGVKRGEAQYSDYKFVTSGVTVPYDINWTPGAPRAETSYQCVYARGNYRIFFFFYTVCLIIL